jgi:hypothetical protein
MGIHLKNTLFHVLTVMVGSRNTPDEAYRVLYFELEDRKRAYDGAMAGRKRNKAKRMRLEQEMASEPNNTAKYLELEADMDELDSGEKTMENAIAGCEHEMEFIAGVMKELLKSCKYINQDGTNLTEAFTACQREEWCLELRKRAENFLLTQGSIPTDHFEVMRAHPDFNEHIKPLIEEVRTDIGLHQLGLHNMQLRTPVFVSMLQEKYAALVSPDATDMQLLAAAEPKHQPLMLESGNPPAPQFINGG